MATYKIVKVWGDPNKRKTTIMTGLTLEEAREHCSRDNTRFTHSSDYKKSWMYVFYKE
jgi:hypothetical protein